MKIFPTPFNLLLLKYFPVAAGTFPQLGEVAVLDLSHNQIIKVEEDSLAGLQVDLLDFTSNLMRRLPGPALRSDCSAGPEQSRYCPLIG